VGESDNEEEILTSEEEKEFVGGNGITFSLHNVPSIIK
jgi:hypothetical protein